jgi:predicted glycosyltransferase
MKKILIYTHNSVGIGHTNRVLSIINGMRKVNDNIEFLVISGTSVPEVFLKNEIELIKLPSTKIIFDGKTQKLIPRYLNENIFETIQLREKIIKDTFDYYKPDVFMVEHNMIGQGWELLPILLEKWRFPKKFKLVFVSRGIIDSPKLMNLNYERKQHLIEQIDIPNLYDNVFVLDSKDNIDFEKNYCFDKKFCSKTKYLGLITSKNKSKLNPIKTKSDLNIGNKKLILFSMGRIGNIEKILDYTVKSFKMLDDNYILKIQLDPYLDKNLCAKIKNKYGSEKNMILAPFSHGLIEEINIADLLICRGGYNTVAELLLTNAKAILFPEVGRTEEEVYRCKKLSKLSNFQSFDERKINFKEFNKAFQQLLIKRKINNNFVFNNEKIARQMLNEMKLL